MPCERLLYKEQSVYDTCENLNVVYCRYCKDKLKLNKIPSIAKSNNMEVCPMPQVIAELSPLERRFLAQIHVFMTIYLLPTNTQLGQRGIAVNFPNAPENFIANKENIPLIAVQFESRTDSSSNTSNVHLIRPCMIYQALSWLKVHNPLYKDIEIADFDLRNNTEFQSSRPQQFDETMAVDFSNDIRGLRVEAILNSDKSSVPSVSIPRCLGRPIDAYDLANGEQLAFPALFADGKNGFGES